MLVAVLLGGAAAQASPVVITDEIDVAATRQGNPYSAYSSATFANNPRSGKYWGDSIQDAADPFDTTQITVNRNDSTNVLTIDLITKFDGNDGITNYADLFFDTQTPDSPDSFNYAIALGVQTKAAGVYTNTGFKTSNDIWASRSQYVYGGYYQFKTTSADYTPGMALASPTRLTSGTKLTNFSVAVTKTSLGSGLYDVRVAITSTSNLSLFDNIDLFWGTGDCSNDAVWGTLASAPVNAPEPTGLALLAGGLAGLGFLRRRRNRPAA